MRVLKIVGVGKIALILVIGMIFDCPLVNSLPMSLYVPRPSFKGNAVAVTKRATGEHNM